MRLHGQPELHRFFRQQPGGEQYARVARVGARGDGADQHIAVLDLDAVVRPVGPAQVFGLLAEAVFLRRRGKELAERAGYLVEVDAVLRPLRARERRLDGREVELELLRIIDLAFLRDTEQALRLEVLGEARDGFIRAAGAAEILDRLRV